MLTPTTSGAEKSAPLVVVNVAGEGEEPGAVNVNGTWLNTPGWKLGHTGNPTFAELQARGHQFVLVDDISKLPFADATVDVVYVNSVCMDTVSWLGPCPSSKEIERTLKPDGVWYRGGFLQERP